jgi:type III secretion protein U
VSTEERTDKASDHKLRQARKRGEIPYSREFSGAAGFAAAYLALWAGWDSSLERISRIVSAAFRPDGYGWPHLAEQVVTDALWIVLPVLVAAVAGGVITGLLQTRGLFSWEPLSPKFERLNPAVGLKELFTSRHLVDLLKVALKIAVTLAVGTMILADSIGPFITNSLAGSDRLGVLELKSVHRLFLFVLVIFLMFSLIDFGHQLYEYAKLQRMSKDEVKREHRELEGMPEYKLALKNTYKGMVDLPVSLDTRSAHVVIANPTHFAVGLYYQPPRVALPLVVCMGADDDALRIREIARDHSIPIFENPALARNLFAALKPGQFIADEHVEAVAEVFRWLRGLP